MFVVLESARKLSFVRDTMPNAERIQWLRKACERRGRRSGWRRAAGDGRFKLAVGLCILKRKQYRLALAYFDFQLCAAGVTAGCRKNSR